MRSDVVLLATHPMMTRRLLESSDWLEVPGGEWTERQKTQRTGCSCMYTHFGRECQFKFEFLVISQYLLCSSVIVKKLPYTVVW